MASDPGRRTAPTLSSDSERVEYLLDRVTDRLPCGRGKNDSHEEHSTVFSKRGRLSGRPTLITLAEAREPKMLRPTAIVGQVASVKEGRQILHHSKIDVGLGLRYEVETQRRIGHIVVIARRQLPTGRVLDGYSLHGAGERAVKRNSVRPSAACTQHPGAHAGDDPGSSSDDPHVDSTLAVGRPVPNRPTRVSARASARGASGCLCEHWRTRAQRSDS